MLKTTQFFALTLAAISLTGCATMACEDPKQIEASLANKFGSKLLSDTYYDLKEKSDNYEDVDIDDVRNAAFSPDATAYAKTQFYLLLVGLYGAEERYEAQEDARQKAISANGFSNEAELNAVRKVLYRSRQMSEILKDIDKIDLKKNAPASPQVRFAPAMPYNARRSGYCYIQYDVTKQGSSENVEALYCSDNNFGPHAVKNVEGWRFHPKKVDGNYVNDTELVTKIAFKLTDACGNLIPE